MEGGSIVLFDITMPDDFERFVRDKNIYAKEISDY